MFKRVITKGILLSFMLTVCSCYGQNSSGLKSDSSPLYLDSLQPTEKRVDDLMERMTLEDKVYQMNQFVGLNHMKKGNPNDDKENNDAQGFYKTLSVNDVSAMCEEGKIGSFLHVLTAKEANYLQE